MFILPWKQSMCSNINILAKFVVQDDDQESVIMSNKNGPKFLCFLPKVEKAKAGKPVTQQNTSSMIVETEKRVKLKTPDELLEAFKERCFLRVSIRHLMNVLDVSYV